MFALSDQELRLQELILLLNASSTLVSHKMRTLVSMKLVRQIKEGKNVYYSIYDDHVLHILEFALELSEHD